jgi:hypothetical protein
VSRDYGDNGDSPLNLLGVPSSRCDGFEPHFGGLRRRGVEEAGVAERPADAFGAAQPLEENCVGDGRHEGTPCR